MNSTNDFEAIVEVAGSYYRAMVSGDEAGLRRLFEARAPIVGNYEGSFLWLDLDGFIDETKGLVGTHGKEECAVEGVRVDGDIAWVSVGGRYAGSWFFDHLALVLIDGNWRITSKTFRVAN